MKLIGSPTSPYVRKVRVVLAEKKLDYRFQTEDVWSEETAINASNPLGKVPCLVMEGGEAVFDSRVIVEYLDTLSPVGRLIPAQGRERAEVKTWEALADGVLDAAILARLEATWPHRQDGERSQAWIDRQMGKVRAGLQAMAQGLGDKPYCSGWNSVSRSWRGAPTTPTWAACSTSSCSAPASRTPNRRTDGPMKKARLPPGKARFFCAYKKVAKRPETK
jgi:glutathione S-transferase